METVRSRPSRRTLLALGAGTAVAATVSAGTAAYADTPSPQAGSRAGSRTGGEEIARRLRGLEREYAARLGVFARDTATGETVAYRADELFPMCSVFKAVTGALVLRDMDRNGEYLARRVHYTAADVTDIGHVPVTGKAENIADGLTVEQLCAAAVSQSDNGAANLLLRRLGGPQAVTRFARSIGDPVTRLDRYEPELNSAEPWRVTDTTSPRAIGTTLGALVLGRRGHEGDRGRLLAPRDRKLLTRWLIENNTNGERFGKGLPEDWVLADKTGGGTAYGVANDAGVVWPPDRAPLLLTVLSTKYDPAGPTDNPLVARAAKLVADALV